MLINLIQRIRSRYGAILALAIPLAVSSIADELTAIVDTALLGRYSVEATAGVGAVSSILFGTLIVIIVMAIGNQILVAQRLAANNLLGAGSIVRHTFVVLPILATIATVILFVFSEPLTRIFSSDQAVIDEGLTYLRVRLIGLPLIAIQVVIFDVYTAAKRTRWVLYAAWVLNIVNIVASALLIFGFGPFPELGVLGAAIGGLLADAAGLLFMVVIFFKHGYVREFRIFSKDFSRKEFKRLFTLSAPTVVSVASLNIGEVIMFVVFGMIGTVEQAAASVVFTLGGIFFSIAFGFYESSQIMSARALGAGNKAVLSKLYRRNLELVVAMFALMTIPLFVAPNLVFRIFTEFENVLQVATSLGVYLAIGLIILGWTMINVAFLRGIGSTLTEMYTTLAAVWVVYVPLTWVFALELGLGALGALLGFIAFWVARGLLNMFFLFRKFKNPEKIVAG